jgi:two-component system NtrC family sensor kinase
LQGENVVIQVSDNGTGIREPDKVFDPFYTTKEVGKGTGLGLSVSYGIVQEHHGTISAKNGKEGAQFTVTLPIGNVASKIEAPPSATPTFSRSSRRRLKALVVDDEESIVDLQISMLSSLGLQPRGVSSAEEAVKVLNQDAFDLIISDVRMPGAMDGFMFYDWVKAHHPRLSRQFIFISGDIFGLSSDQLKYIAAIPHIQKPFQLESYSQLIQRVLKT